MKPSRRNCVSSDTIYQGAVIILYVKGISDKFRHVGNNFSVRAIFKTKHLLQGTLMKPGPTCVQRVSQNMLERSEGHVD
jgi:hypothetical protein